MQLQQHITSGLFDVRYNTRLLPETNYRIRRQQKFPCDAPFQVNDSFLRHDCLKLRIDIRVQFDQQRPMNLRFLYNHYTVTVRCLATDSACVKTMTSRAPDMHMRLFALNDEGVASEQSP